MAFTFKSLMSEMYLDDLRYKTLRGLEGRALAGFATGNVAYGFHTVPVTNERGDVIGNKIEIHEAEAKIVRRMFRESAAGRSLTTIAHGLNSDGIPSPRVGSRHKNFGWGSSTIRAILYNERYVGTWRFKEKRGHRPSADPRGDSRAAALSGWCARDAEARSGAVPRSLEEDRCRAARSQGAARAN
jgi:DNA invertase Pin-like site-specific DNA recombinase